MQCTDEEIAAWFNVTTKTIERRRKVKAFAEVMNRGKAKDVSPFAGRSLSCSKLARRWAFGWAKTFSAKWTRSGTMSLGFRISIWYCHAESHRPCELY
jgi:hypothetical protein